MVVVFMLMVYCVVIIQLRFIYSVLSYIMDSYMILVIQDLLVEYDNVILWGNFFYWVFF